MTKYTSNEQYEKDKDLAIAFCESIVIERTSAEIKQMKRIANLLKQSKWIGCQDDNNVNNSILVTIKKYDEIVNPPVVDDTNWEEVIEDFWNLWCIIPIHIKRKLFKRLLTSSRHILNIKD